MVSKTKHRNTARKRRHTLRRKKQRGGQTDAERHAELTRLWLGHVHVCEGDRDRAEAKVVELNAKVVELNAKVAQLVSENDHLVETHDTSDPNAQDMHGNTKLHHYASLGNRVEVERLIGARADPNIQNMDGSTPVLEPAWRGDLGMVQDLVAGGADLGIANQRGQTPLNIAEAARNRGIAAFIREQIQRAFR